MEERPLSQMELIISIHGDVKELVRVKFDHENRIRVLEALAAKLIALALLSGTVGAIIGHLWK